MNSKVLIEEFKKLVKETLKDDLNKSGTVLYSNYYTLKVGKLYILGFNPGGDPNSKLLKEQTIDKDLENPEKWDRNYSEYTQKWGNYEPGKDPLQRSIRFLVEDVFNLPINEVCASNLIFIRSKSESELGNWKEIAEKHWKIHQKIINEIVKPQIIITFGLETFHFVLEKLSYDLGFFFPAEWGNWKIKAAVNRKLFNKPMLIFGFPHFSRYKLVPASDSPNGLGERERAVKERITEIIKIAGI